MMARDESYKESFGSLFITLLKTDRVFQTGLLLKCVFASLFASAYLSDLFSPFIHSAIHHSFWSVYTDFYRIKANAFPYPPVMLYILTASRLLGNLLGSSINSLVFVDLFLIRFPLLMGDIIIMLILIKWVHNIRLVILWYWLNPIIFYITYVHGQLDVLPTAFLCISLYFLFSDRFYFFVVFMALACATKFHIIMAVPLLCIYLMRIKKYERSILFKGSLLFVVLMVLLNLPFLLQSEYIDMVYRNPEQNKILGSFYNIFEGYRIIFVPASYLMVAYLMLDFRFIHKDVLLIFLALGFGTITFFIVPSQGWYLWNMPFFIYFAIRASAHERYLFILLNLSYFLFFLLIPQSDLPLVAQFVNPAARTKLNLYHYLQRYGIDTATLLQLSFTLLQTTLFLFCISLFRLGVLQIRRYKIYHHPYLIGICGDSGTGKSMLADRITAIMGSRNTLNLRGDDMHRWERGHDKWEEMTHLNPQANWLHRDLADLIKLKAGKSIRRRTYSHTTGKFSEYINMSAEKVIIYEGLHSFYLREVSNIYDLKIYMKPSEQLRRYWKIQRDVNQRGHSEKTVLEDIEKRIPDAVSHILDQQKDADIVLSIIEGLQPSVIMGAPHPFALEVTCSNYVYFEELIEKLKTLTTVLVFHEIDRIRQRMVIEGEVSSVQISDVADSLQLNVEDLIGNKPVWSDNFFGIMQLFVLYFMFNQLKSTGLLLQNDPA